MIQGLELPLSLLVAAAVTYSLLYAFKGNERAAAKNVEAGRKALSNRDYDLALSYANAAIRLDVNRASAYELRGLAYHGNQSYAQAIADFTKAMEWFPYEGSLYRLRADAYAASGSYAKAIVDYSDAIRLDPGDVLAVKNRALAYAGQAPGAELPCGLTPPSSTGEAIVSLTINRSAKK